jgi:hypothetical protein
MHVHVDEPWQHPETSRTDDLGVPGRRDLASLRYACDAIVLDKNRPMFEGGAVAGVNDGAIFDNERLTGSACAHEHCEQDSEFQVRLHV